MIFISFPEKCHEPATIPLLFYGDQLLPVAFGGVLPYADDRPVPGPHGPILTTGRKLQP